MENKLILTIDMGTQSLRAGLIDKKGNIQAISRIKYPQTYFSLKPGYTEQDPDVYFKALCQATNKLFKENPNIDKNSILAISMGSFRDSAVMCDENMKPVRPAILWLDQRQAEAKEKISWYSKFLFGIVGKTSTLVLNRKRTPAHWVKEHEPEIWNKVRYYMNVSTYVIYCLTGEYKDTASDYAGHFPINFKKKNFYKSDKHFQGQIFGIKLNMLCQLVSPDLPVGYVSEEAAKLSGIPQGLKVFVPGSDKGCEVLGLGAIEKDVAAVSCGTASTVGIMTKRYHTPEPLLPSYPGVVPGYHNLELQIYRGFWMLGWFAREFAEKETDESQTHHMHVEDVLNSKLKEVPPGADGLVLQPYWGPGLGRPLSRGAVIGFSDTHTKLHLYRAIIEGIDYELKRALEVNIEKRAHVKIKKIKIAGGASQSDEICQIAADIFNLPTYRVQTFETSSLGAAIAAFVALKEYPDIQTAVKNMVRQGKCFIPNKENAKQYDFLYKHAYKKMYPALKGIYKDIRLNELKKNN